jgi:plasmid maintenance system antidote protein VapI
MKGKSKIEIILRAELAKTTESRYSISHKMGIAEPILCRFVSGERGLSIESAEALLEHFGYQLPCKRAKK